MNRLLLLAFMALVLGDIAHGQNETTIDTTVGDNPPAQAFMRAMNGRGDYRHRWRLRQSPPNTIDHRVSDLRRASLGYTIDRGQCVLWSAEGVIATISVRHDYECLGFLSYLTGRFGPALRQGRLYKTQPARIGAEVFASDTIVYCRFSISLPTFHALLDTPTTLSPCVALFEALTGMKWWEP